MLSSLAVALAATAEKKSGLPQLNVNDFAPQLIWLALTFMLLYLILSRVALPRIGEVIEERKDRIQRDLDAAERLKQETEKALKAYEQALADARGKAGVMARDNRAALVAETDKERAKVQAEMAAKLAEAETRIAATKAKALASVNEIAAGTASAVVGRLLGQDATPDEVAKALGK
jgi:F-type H+-transporting ATPase subunit b